MVSIKAILKDVRNKILKDIRKICLNFELLSGGGKQQNH